MTPGGYTVPTGALLRMTPWVFHRDERWFPQAERFLPERFVEGAPPIPKGAWMPFGTGPRVCIGQHFAMLEMTMLATMLLQRYTWQLGGDPTASHEPELHVTLRPRQPVQLWLTRRENRDDTAR